MPFGALFREGMLVMLLQESKLHEPIHDLSALNTQRLSHTIVLAESCFSSIQRGGIALMSILIDNCAKTTR